MASLPVNTHLSIDKGLCGTPLEVERPAHIQATPSPSSTLQVHGNNPHRDSMLAHAYRRV
eukprot:1191277-Prorocentrum_minimum.AAC.7